jgi:hypothetical protein
MSSNVPRKSERRTAGVGLDGVVPESANRGLGKSGKEGGSAKGKAAGAVVEKSDVLADPTKGRKKTPTAVVVPISNVPGAVVVGKKSDVRPDPKARKTPAAEGVVLGGVPGAVVVAKSDADPKGQKQPAVDGIAMCVGVRSAVVGEKTPDLMGLDEVPGDVTGMVVGGKLVNLGSPVSSPVSTDMRGSRTEGAVSAVGDTVVDSIGAEAGYNPQVRGSLVLEKVSIREKAAAVANLPSLGGTPEPPASIVHVCADQDDKNSSHYPQLKEPPEQLQAMDDWCKKVAPPHRAAGPRETKAAVGGTFSGPNRELMKDLRRFESEHFKSEQARLGASPRKSVELMEASEEVEEDSGVEEGKQESDVELIVINSEEEDSVGEGGEEESVMASVVLESDKEWEEDDDSESMEPPLNDDDSYAGGLYEDEESDDDSDNLAYYEAPKGSSGRSLVPGGPSKPPTDGVSEEEAAQMIKDWRVARKKYTDGLAKKRRDAKRNKTKDVPVTVVAAEKYTGVVIDSIRLMSTVADSPMAVGHTYPSTSKELALIRIAEEANYSGCQVTIGRSDLMRVQAFGRNGSSFEVKVYCSDKFGWRVSACNTRSSEAMNADVATEVQEQAQAGVVTKGVTVHECDDLFGEEGTADNNAETIANNTDTIESGRTPFKSRWLIPLLKTAIGETTNILNKHIRLLLAPYIKDKFLSASLLQNARTLSRRQIFGYPDDNVQFVHALVTEMQSRNHDVFLVTKNSTEVGKMLDEMILGEQIALCKTQGIKC